MKTAIITGVLGQDGSYLAELLLENDFEVYGLYRRCSTGTTFDNIKSVLNHNNLKLVEGDILEYPVVSELITDIKPDMFFNLAAQSHVGYSFKIPSETFRVNAEAVIAQLDLIKKYSPNTRYYQAGTSEEFGGLNCPLTGYTESSPLNPRSPYAIAKVAARNSVKNYREAFGMFACTGFLFNHCSPRRGEDFATKKITQGVANIKKGKASFIEMGNMEACRDEGHAKDYVKAQLMMLEQPTPDDYVVATGETASIKQMLEYVCDLAGLDYNDVYKMNEKFMRPSDVPYLLGDSSKIRTLGWAPEYNWKTALKEMYEHDMNS